MERQSSNGAGARGAVKREPVRRRTDRTGGTLVLIGGACEPAGDALGAFLRHSNALDGGKIQVSSDGTTWNDITDRNTATTWNFVDPLTHTSSFTYSVRVLDAAGTVQHINLRYADAERAYADVLRQGPESAFYEQALYKHGWSQFKRQLYEESLASFFGTVRHRVGRDEVTMPVARGWHRGFGGSGVR